MGSLRGGRETLDAVVGREKYAAGKTNEHGHNHGFSVLDGKAIQITDQID